jgi:CRP/FNR family transcriptional regulator, anaerobic regulatory protein
MHMIIEKLKDGAAEVSYPKNYLLVKEGMNSKKIWILKKGLARYIYYRNGKEFTGWIDSEGDIVGSVYSTLGYGQARENIQLLEDALLHEINIDSISNDEAEFLVLKSAILEYYFLEMENRVKFFQSLDGRERYSFILKNNPDLIHRVPLKILSTFLGLTPESLSRIRGSIS